MQPFLLQPRHLPGGPGPLGALSDTDAGWKASGHKNHRDRSLHRSDRQGLPRLQLPPNRPDRNPLRPARDGIYLPHLWYVPLPELCDRTRRGTLRRADPRRPGPGKPGTAGLEPVCEGHGPTLPLPAEALSGRAGKTVPGPGPHPGRERMLPAGGHPFRLRPVGGRWPGNPAGRPSPRFHHRRPPGGDRLCRGGCGLSLALSNRP